MKNVEPLFSTKPERKYLEEEAAMSLPCDLEVQGDVCVKVNRVKHYQVLNYYLFRSFTRLRSLPKCQSEPICSCSDSHSILHSLTINFMTLH